MPVIRISEELFKEVQKYAEPLIDNFESALWKALRRNSKLKPIKQRKTISHASGELTSPRDFWKPILESMVERGGCASRSEYQEDVKRKMEGKFKKGDFEHNLDGTLKWSKQVDYQRLAMANEGLIRKGPRKGYWEITKLGREWLSSQQ